MTTTYNIRAALSADLPAIIDIYNSIIDEGIYTADLEPYTTKARKAWFISLKEKNNIFVITNMDRIIGYFYFSPWRQGRQALKTTAEISFYIKPDFRGQGLGTRILSKALDLAREKKLENLLAILLDTNSASISLLEKFHFEICGHLPQVAQLKDSHCGQYIMIRKVN